MPAMKVYDSHSYNMERVQPEEIYAPHLEVISGIPFTRREIDIIACVLSGRVVKKIALLLLISPKTVENHLRNIMLKLGCRTQGGIIDFIEKSGKFILVKKYYSSLLLQSAFELELKKIKIRHKINSRCVLIYDNDQKSKLSIIRQIERHLRLIGITVIIENREKDQSTTPLIEKIDNQLTDSIIYIVPKTFENQNIEISNLIYATNKNPSSIIFVLIEPLLDPLVIPKELFTSAYIDLAEQRNYYFLIFELLKKLFPGFSFDENLTEFIKQSDTLFDAGLTRTLPEGNSSLTEPIIQNISPSVKKKTKKQMFAIGIFCFLFFFGGVHFYLQKVTLSTLSKTAHSITNDSIMVSDLMSGRPVNWNLPRQDHIFVGREKLLEDLHNKLKSQSDKPDSPRYSKPLAISACTGMGGIGKTQLALQYAHHTKHTYTLKAWFPAENPDRLHQKYIEFAKALGYAEKIVTIESALFYVNNWLLKHPGWLLIFDNVNSYEEIAPFISEGGGHIILTTRNRQWPDKFEILPIDIMTEEESCKLMKTLIHRKIDTVEISDSKELVKSLGHLPLAIAQASAYIQQNKIKVSEYLTLYKKHESELLLDNSAPEGTNNLSVAVTWEISLKELAKKARIKNEPFIAHFVLTASAYLAPETISKDLLLAFLKEAYPNLISPELVLSKAIGQLWKYSLINTDENGDISIHRLMQVVLRNQHKKNVTLKEGTHHLNPVTQDWYNFLLKGIRNLCQKNSQLPENEIRFRRFFPHLQALLLNAKKLWGDEEMSELGWISSAIGYVYHLVGDPKNAEIYSKLALKIHEKHYGTSHEYVARDLNALGFQFVEMGDVNKAKPLLERSLTIFEKLHGKNYVMSIYPMSNLGKVYRELGEPKKAKELLESAVAIINANLKQKELLNLILAITLTRLGEVYWDLNQIDKITVVLEDALNILEKNFGHYHPRVARILLSLSEACGDSGNYQKQKSLIERALIIDEQYYGKTHPETAKTLACLGDNYRLLGDAKKGKELLENALNITEQYYGTNHPEITKTLNKLGDAYRDIGDIIQAKALHQRALNIRQLYYGDNHPEVAKSLNCLGYDYGFLGNAQQQKELSAQALIIQEAHYGGNHPEIVSTVSNLAYAYRALGDAQYSKILQERALKIKKEHFGVNHPEVAKTMASLGDVYGDMGEIEQKKILLEQALKIEELYYGKKNPFVAKILTSLGDAYRELGDFKKSKELLKCALEIREHYYGIEHPEVAKTLISLGDTYQYLGDLKKAREIHERTLKIREQYYGMDHPEVSKILTTLGEVYLLLGDSNTATTTLERALAIKENFYGKNHPEVAKTLLKFIHVNLKLKKNDEAKLLGYRCHSIFLESYGKENCYTKKIAKLLTEK